MNTYAALIAVTLAVCASVVTLRRMFLPTIHRLVDRVLEHVHGPHFIRAHESREEPPR